MVLDESLLTCDLAKIELQAIAFVFVKHISVEKFVEPDAAFRAEQIREVVLDEIAMKDRMNLVLELCLVMDEALSVGHEVSQPERVGVGLPDFGKIIDACQFGQHAGIYTIGLRPPVCDQLRLHGVREDHSCFGVERENARHRVGRCRDFQCDGVGWSEMMCDPREVLSCGAQTEVRNLLSVRRRTICLD